MKNHGVRKTILIVDDEVCMRNVLEKRIASFGYETVTAKSGEECLHLVEQRPPDLILLDVMMPKKNGYEVCLEMKGDPALSDVHIIMLTAEGQQADREKAIAVEADEFVTKPFSPQEIVARLKELA